LNGTRGWQTRIKGRKASASSYECACAVHFLEQRPHRRGHYYYTTSRTTRSQEKVSRADCPVGEFPITEYEPGDKRAIGRQG